MAPDLDDSLEFRSSVIENWLNHPDWRERIINVSDLLGLFKLELGLVHPMDLILTKLKRNSDRDEEDCDALALRYIDSGTSFLNDLNEALSCYVGPADDVEWLRELGQSYAEFIDATQGGL